MSSPSCGVGWRTSWRPWAIAGALLPLVILGFATGFAFSAAFPSTRPLVGVREDRVMADVPGHAADAGFTALVVPDGQPVLCRWPVGELADPAGFTLEYESPGPWIAEYRETGPVSAEDFQSMVAAGQYVAASQPVEPGWSQVIPEVAAHQDLTVQGGPAAGLEFVDATGQSASVLVSQHP